MLDSHDGKKAKGFFSQGPDDGAGWTFGDCEDDVEVDGDDGDVSTRLQALPNRTQPPQIGRSSSHFRFLVRPKLNIRVTFRK